jgi:hypothetical protein
VYVQSLEGKPVPLSPPLVTRNVAIAPDGRLLAVLPDHGRLTIYPSEPGEPRVLPSDDPLAPVFWSRDGRSILVQHLARSAEVPARISRLDLITDRITPWKTVAPRSAMGVNSITRVLVAGDEESIIFNIGAYASQPAPATAVVGDVEGATIRGNKCLNQVSALPPSGGPSCIFLQYDHNALVAENECRNFSDSGASRNGIFVNLSDQVTVANCIGCTTTGALLKSMTMWTPVFRCWHECTSGA